jgi:hypothetical protein
MARRDMNPRCVRVRQDIGVCDSDHRFANDRTTSGPWGLLCLSTPNVDLSSKLNPYHLLESYCRELEDVLRDCGLRIQ